MTLPAILIDRLRLPVIASPMLTVSGPELVIAQAAAGVVGSFPSLNARPQQVLRQWLSQISDALARHDANNPHRRAAPYAVNLMDDESDDRLDKDLAAIVEFEVPIVITSRGTGRDVNEAVHSYGGLVLHDVTHNEYARRAVDRGADGLIAVAAGGHTCTQLSFALIQEIRAWFDGPLLLSGSITHGRSVLAAQDTGADLACVGPAFIATEEANASSEYKQMIVETDACDVVYSNFFTGGYDNYLRASIIAFGLDPDSHAQWHTRTVDFGAADGREGIAGPNPWRGIRIAGRGIDLVNAVPPVAAVVNRLVLEYAEAKMQLLQRI